MGSPTDNGDDAAAWSVAYGVLGGIIGAILIGACVYGSRGWWGRSFMRSSKCDHKCKKGRQGDKGRKGDKGCKGDRGIRGTYLIMLPGPPTETVKGEVACCVLEGDIYIDTTTGTWYQLVCGNWVEQPFSLSPPATITGDHLAQGLWQFTALGFVKTEQSVTGATVDPLVPQSSWVSITSATVPFTIESIDPTTVFGNGGLLLITNDSGIAITLADNAGSSNYNIYTPDGADITSSAVPHRASFILILDKTSATPGWRVLGYAI